MEAVTLRLQSLSPMEEAEAESRSLELPSPSPQDGRRSTQGIPEVCGKPSHNQLISHFFRSKRKSSFPTQRHHHSLSKVLKETAERWEEISTNVDKILN